MLHDAAPSVGNLCPEMTEEDCNFQSERLSRPNVIPDPCNPSGNISAPSFLELQAKGGPDFFVHACARAELPWLKAATFVSWRRLGGLGLPTVPFWRDRLVRKDVLA